jgi:hypothetical protein
MQYIQACLLMLVFFFLFAHPLSLFLCFQFFYCPSSPFFPFVFVSAFWLLICSLTCLGLKGLLVVVAVYTLTAGKLNIFGLVEYSCIFNAEEFKTLIHVHLQT